MNRCKCKNCHQEIEANEDLSWIHSRDPGYYQCGYYDDVLDAPIDVMAEPYDDLTAEDVAEMLEIEKSLR